MLTSAAILLIALLILGGAIAVLGDRLGTKVGKARLRLFGLRPRQTATVVTVLTGTAISASTLAILFTFSKPLRQGVFEIDEILKQKRIAESDLGAVRNEKARVEEELAKVTEDRRKVQEGLLSAQTLFDRTNKEVTGLKGEVKGLRVERQNLAAQRQTLIRQRDELAQRLARERQALLKQRDDLLRAFQLERERVNQERQKLTAQRDELLARLPELQGRVRGQEQELNQRLAIIRQKQQQIAAQDEILQQREKSLQQLQVRQQALQAELDRRDEKIAERDREAAERDRAIAKLDEQISQRDATLMQREASLKQSEERLNLLQEQIASLAQDYQGLRQGNVAIARGQVLGFGVLRIVNPTAAKDAIDQLLRQANRNAISATRPNNNGDFSDRVVQISQAQVEELTQRIDDGQDYVIRILSAGNYVEQEKNIFVVADAALNREIFKQEEAIAAVALESAAASRAQLENQLDLLLATSQFRARRAGLLGEIRVGEGDITTLEQVGALTNFIEQIMKTKAPIDSIQAIAVETVYTSGPLKLKLVAMQKGTVIFSTQS